MSTPSTTASPGAAPIEIFRAGRHRAMTGEELAFSAEDLAAAVAAYDPALHEAPIVVGHPQTDAPAYGWVKGLALAGETLSALPDQVEPAFAEMVRAGRFKHVSAAFFRPEAKGNPTPGKWYLRHVGFLGAQPPAVKGLKTPAFAAEEEGVVVFAEMPPWTLGSIARLLRGIRDWMLEQGDREAVDRLMPSWTLDELQESAGAARAAAERAEPGPQPAFSETSTGDPAVTNPTTPPAAPSSPAVASPAAPDEQARLTAEREQLAADRAAFAEQRQQHLAAENAAFLDKLVAEARLPSGLRDQALAFMGALDAEETVAFAEGAEPQTRREAFKGLLGGLPQSVAFGETAAPEEGEETASFAAPSGYVADPERLALHRKATAYAAKHQVDYVTAVQAVS